MHKISPYCVRCFNPNAEGPLDKRYYQVNKIGQHDLFVMLEAFITPLAKGYTIVEDAKQVFRFSSVTFDHKKRLAYGWMEVGTYGIKSDIIDISNGEVDFEKAQTNAEILKHYFCFYVPTDVNEAICLLHSYGIHGVKTLFYERFLAFFRQIIQLNLQMNPLSYKAALAEWQNATSKELIVTKFSGLSDIADVVEKMGHAERQLVMKAPRKLTFGKLKDFFEKGTEQQILVESLSPFGAQVKTTVNLGNRKRTFVVGHNANNSVCEIELDETDVKHEGGVPVLESIHAWSIDLIKEYCVSMYPGMQVLL